MCVVRVSLICDKSRRVYVSSAGVSDRIVSFIFVHVQGLYLLPAHRTFYTIDFLLSLSSPQAKSLWCL